VKLRIQRKQWDHLAREDPFWAILNEPEKRNGRWDPEEFYTSGRHEIAGAMRWAAELGYPALRHTALDFGCGAGRLTQALAGWFDHVTGVDISPVMLDLARKHDTAGDRCNYVLNSENHLRQFESNHFDFIYSRLVLQHLPPRHARRYIGEFVRVLRPSGLALFQLPSNLTASSLWEMVSYYAHMLIRRRLLRNPYLMEMYGIPQQTVERDLRAIGGRILAAKPDASAPNWDGLVYAVTK
jgi:SAM-dependent methyltransferase